MTIKFTHCDLCGRELNTEKSKRFGIGPDCIAKHSLKVAILFSIPKDPGLAFNEHDVDIIVAYPHELQVTDKMTYGVINFSDQPKLMPQVIKGRPQVLFRENEPPYEIVNLLSPTENNIQKGINFARKYLQDPRVRRIHRIAYMDPFSTYLEKFERDGKVREFAEGDIYGLHSNGTREKLFETIYHLEQAGYDYWHSHWEEAVESCAPLVSKGFEDTILEDEILMARLHGIWWESGYIRSWDGILNIRWIDRQSTESLSEEETKWLVNMLGWIQHGEAWLNTEYPNGYGSFDPAGSENLEPNLANIFTVSVAILDAKLEQFAVGLDIPTESWLH